MPRKPRLGRIYHPKVTQPDGTTREVKTWWLAYYVRGSQVRESSKSTKYSDAEALLRRRVAEIETGTYAGKAAQRITVCALLADVLYDYEINGKVLERAEISVKHLKPVFGHVRASHVDTKRLNTYIAHRRSEGAANASINRELALLKRGFSLARSATPPRVNWVPNFPRLKENPPRSGFFEHSDFVVLRSELPDHLKPVITFAYFTGCRKNEILMLRWDQVDLLAKVVRLNPGETKNDDGRVIPLADELYEVLAFQRQVRDQLWPEAPFVFHRYGKRIKDFRGAWEEASKRAEVWNEEANKPKFIFHDLRRTGARNLVRAGVPERVVMLIGGWKTRSVFERYNVITESDLHDAAAKLERYVRMIESEYKGAKKGQTPDSLDIIPS